MKHDRSLVYPFCCAYCGKEDASTEEDCPVRSAEAQRLAAKRGLSPAQRLEASEKEPEAPPPFYAPRALTEPTPVPWFPR